MYEWIYIELLTLLPLFFPNVCSKEIPCDKPYLAKNNLMCYPCSAGYFKISDCVRNGEQARCQPCRSGEYMPSCDNSTKCATCGLACSPRQVIVKHCSATNDIECQCKDGYYWQPYQNYCKTYSKCGKGEGIAAYGTPFEDTKCVPCKTGVSYSDNESFAACKPCSTCNSTLIVTTECSATHNVVCGIPFKQISQPKTKLDGRILAIIIVSVAAFAIVVVIIACILIRKLRRARNTKNTESNKVELPSFNEVNCNSGPQTNFVDERDLLNQNVGNSERNSCSDNESNTESTATDCNERDNITVKSNVYNQNNGENDSQTNNTANETKALNHDNDKKPREFHEEKGDNKEETCIEHAQNDKSKSDDESTFPTPPENDNNSKRVTSIETCNNTEQEAPTRSDLDSSNVSLDAAAVSPRGSVQSQELRRNSEETSLTDEITPEDQTTKELEMENGNEIKKEHQDVRSVKGFQSDCKVWLDAITILSKNLKMSDFNFFVRELVANTNEGMIETIDTVIDHAKEEKQSCKEIIYDVMFTWRKATPKASIKKIFQALEECELNRKSKQLAKELTQKGHGDILPAYSASEQDNGMYRTQSRDTDHEIENLKEHSM